MTSSEQIKLLNDNPLNIWFHKRIRSPLCADAIEILQVNVGKRCNLSCKHCHVEAGPNWSGR